jgi:hypothetical protein
MKASEVFVTVTFSPAGYHVNAPSIRAEQKPTVSLASSVPDLTTSKDIFSKSNPMLYS